MKILKTSLILLVILLSITFQAGAQTSRARDKTLPLQYYQTLKEYRTDKPSKTTDSSPAKALEPIHYYQNSNGNTVQAPTNYNKPPQGATAICQDGTYSFLQHRSGTCSGHGGVARWL